MNINVSGGAFNVEVSFMRIVTYDAGQRKGFAAFGRTWETAIVGTHGSSAAGILAALDVLLDKFLYEYLRANE